MPVIPPRRSDVLPQLTLAALLLAAAPHLRALGLCDVSSGQILAALERLWDRGGRHFKFVDRTFNLNLKISQSIMPGTIFSSR